jgi:hypothetical protein
MISRPIPPKAQAKIFITSKLVIVGVRKSLGLRRLSFYLAI